MNESTEKQIIALANIIEIGKRVVLNIKSDFMKLPEKDWTRNCDNASMSGAGGATSIAERVSEDFAAELRTALEEQAIVNEVKANAQ